jgi:hypothetical protein
LTDFGFDDLPRIFADVALVRFRFEYLYHFGFSTFFSTLALAAVLALIFASSPGQADRRDANQLLLNHKTWLVLFDALGLQSTYVVLAFGAFSTLPPFTRAAGMAALRTAWTVASAIGDVQRLSGKSTFGSECETHERRRQDDN